jgi:hypothetical protein
MKNNEMSKIEFSESILRLLDGTITVEQFNQLKNKLKKEPEAIHYYVDFVNICSTILEQSEISTTDMLSDDILQQNEQLSILKKMAEHESKADEIEVAKEDSASKEPISEEERQRRILAFIKEEKRWIEEERQRKEEEQRLKGEELRLIRLLRIQRRQRILKLQRAAKKTWKYAKISAVAAVSAIFVYMGYFLMQPTPVATLTDMANAEWENQVFSGELESRLLPGPTKLTRGYAQITFNDGTEVIIEAPAKIDLKKSNRAYLELGKLSAKVPQQAQGFAVDTPSAAMIDLGTEFGVEVKEDGTSDFHVFKGKVALTAGTKSDRGKNSQVVKAGSAKRVKTGSKMIKDIPFTGSKFARTVHPAPVEVPVKSIEPVEVIEPVKPVRPDESKYPSPYVQAVHQTGPVAYWPFNQDSKQIGNKLQYVKKAGIKAIRPVPGNGKCDDALKLNGKNSHVWARDRDIVGNWAQNGFSLVLWIRPDTIARQNIILNAEPDDPYSNYSRQLFINNEGKFAFWILVMEPDIPDDLYPLTLTSSTLAQPGIWYHVAVTVDPDDGISMFVNGTEESNLSLDNQVFDFKPEERDRIYIGSSACGHDDDRERMNSFTGGLDEIARYNRALTAQEIKGLYNSVGYNKD